MPWTEPSLCKLFGQFDQDPPIRRILDLVESNDQPQTFNDSRVDLMIPKQLQQFIATMIGIVRAQGQGSGSE
jgi:hypothetical protein